MQGISPRLWGYVKGKSMIIFPTSLAPFQRNTKDSPCSLSDVWSAAIPLKKENDSRGPAGARDASRVMWSGPCIVSIDSPMSFFHYFS